MSPLKSILCAIGIVVALLIAGTIDYHTELAIADARAQQGDRK